MGIVMRPQVVTDDRSVTKGKMKGMDELAGELKNGQEKCYEMGEIITSSLRYKLTFGMNHF